MVVKTKESVNVIPKYSFTRKAGRSIIEQCPVFSPDGETLAIIVENKVRVYNIHTGDCIRTLESDSDIEELVGICFDNDGYNLYGCSNSGLLITWTWEKGAVLREVGLEALSRMKVLTFNLEDNNNCFITAIGPQYENVYLGSFCPKTGVQIHEYGLTKVKYYGMLRVSLGWCNGERFAAIVNATGYLYIQNLHKPHIRSRINNYNEFRILNVSAHRSQSAVAIVDTLGRATILRGNLFDVHSIARELMHWHYLPPFAVCFSMEGSYLYTGGMEKVLLKWTIGDLAYRSNEKQFIPRLPGIVRFITVSNSHVAMALSNNSVVIANGQMRVVSTILECGGLSPVARAFGTSLVYHRGLGALLMGGRPGYLQLYSASTDKVLYNIDITESNTIPPESKSNLLPLETEVTCAAISANGNWLVTSEYRNDGITYPEERLKFWSLEKRGVPFRQCTCVNRAHGGCNIVSIALNTTGDFCVTAGGDQKFRIWKRERNTWICLTACYYSSGVAQFKANGIHNDIKKNQVLTHMNVVETASHLKQVSSDDIIMRVLNMHKQNAVDTRTLVRTSNVDSEYDMGEVAISQDGSLIAAWFGCKLTLWDTHLCSLRTSLSHPALRPKGLHVQFGTADAGHYLVCTSDNALVVFSLLSLTVKWLVQLKPTCLVADPFSAKMAVLTKENDLIVFTPHNSTPVLKYNRLLDPKFGTFKLSTFAQANKDEIRMYMMKDDSEIYCFEPQHAPGSRLEVISKHNIPTSNFSALLAEQRLTEVQPEEAADLDKLNTESLGHSAITQFLSAAPHMVPPVSLLSTAFLEHISGQDNSIDTETDVVAEDTMELDQSSDDEAEVTLNGPYAPKTTQLWTPNYEQVKEKRLKKILKEPLLHVDATASIFKLT